MFHYVGQLLFICYGFDVVSKSQVCDRSSSNADCAYMTFRCICHDAFEEDVEECWGKRKTLSYSDCGVEPFPYGIVEKNRFVGLCRHLFNVFYG